MKRLAVFLLSLMMLTGCRSAGAETQRYTATFLNVFDTASQVVIYTDSQQKANTIAQQIHGELTKYHKLFDQYHDYPGVTGVYRLNQEAWKKPVRVDDELFQLLKYAKEMHSLTNGRVNIAMGSVLSLWHEAREHGLAHPVSAQLPSMDALKSASAHIDPAMLVLDEDKRTVFFADDQLRLDLGAIAKGYAVERVADFLAEKGVTGVLLSIGGNVRAVGVRPDGSAFPTGLQNPDLSSAKAHLCVVGLSNASLVTSGSYQRFYTVDNRQYHHIIDPDTLMPAAHMLSVSVLTEDSGMADALSTALFNMPVEDGLQLIESLPQAEAFWVLMDGSTIASSGFEAFLIP